MSVVWDWCRREFPGRKCLIYYYWKLVRKTNIRINNICVKQNRIIVKYSKSIDLFYSYLLSLGDDSVFLQKTNVLPLRQLVKDLLDLKQLHKKRVLWRKLLWRICSDKYREVDNVYIYGCKIYCYQHWAFVKLYGMYILWL